MRPAGNTRHLVFTVAVVDHPAALQLRLYFLQQ
jgi:IS5 family transposase